MLSLLPILICNGLANISFCMALSTFIANKNIQTFGIPIRVIPILLFVYMMSNQEYFYIYTIFWIPIIPTSALILNLTLDFT